MRGHRQKVIIGEAGRRKEVSAYIALRRRLANQTSAFYSVVADFTVYMGHQWRDSPFKSCMKLKVEAQIRFRYHRFYR